MLTCVSDKPQVESEVVDAGNLQCQQFLGLEEMVEIGLGVQTVELTSVRVDGCKVLLPLLVTQVHRSLIGE